MRRILRTARRFSVGVVLTTMLASFLPAAVFADGVTIGVVSAQGVSDRFDDLSKLVSAVKKLENKDIQIEMESDWGNERLVIPEGAHVTLNMNGHIFNRNLSKNESQGEVIRLEDKATLVINGGEGGPHPVRVWSGEVASGSVNNSQTKDIPGGVIAGGFSNTGAGGIDLFGLDTQLELNDVTIAGCRANKVWGTAGNGGGICVHGGSLHAGRIFMNNSTITGCYAGNSGGGLHQDDHNKFTLDMRNSHIDGNLCGGDGGGISIFGESIDLKADEQSTVNSNQCSGDGGGIYLRNGNVTVSGFTVSGNRSGKNGGGICTLEKGIRLGNLEITENVAAENGGGIFIGNDGNTLSNLTVLSNRAAENGGGIWAEKNVDEGFQLNGSCVVRDNTRTAGEANNLQLRDSSCRLGLHLAITSDVHMAYAEGLDLKDWILVTPGSSGDDGKGKNTTDNKASNCIRYLTSDLPDWQFTFNRAANYRKIYYVRIGGTDLENTGTPHTLKASERILPPWEGMAETGKEVAGEHGTYPLLRGYFRSGSERTLEDRVKVFYYSDGFFDSDPFQYDEHLATASLCMAMAGGGLNDGGFGEGVDYSNKHAGGRQILADIGCDDQRIYAGDYNLSRPEENSMGVTIASKEVVFGEEVYTLVPVVVRGLGYEVEWVSNVTIGNGSVPDGEAQGLREAAEIVMQEIGNYLKRYDLEQAAGDGKVIFWLSGYSRGGAACNLAGRRIREKYHNARLFDYTFECPKSGMNHAQKLEDAEYFCIHNVINRADLVPYFVMDYMGFVRYGVDHYFPGGPAGEVVLDTKPIAPSAAGNANVVAKSRSYHDNTAFETKSSLYEKLRDEKMLDQLDAIDPDFTWDDYFHIAKLQPELSELVMGGEPLIETGSDAYNAEQYLETLMECLGRWVVPTRSSLADPSGNAANVSYQKALQDILYIIMKEGLDHTRQMLGQLSGITGSLSSVSLDEVDPDYINLLGKWSSLSETKRQNLCALVWRLIEQTGALDELDGEDRNTLRNDLPVLLDLLFRFVEGDYKSATLTGNEENRIEMLATLIHNTSGIISNHFPEITLAWMRSMDSYYENERTPYLFNRNISVPAPAAWGIAGGKTRLSEDGTASVFHNHETILLDSESICGEIIHYDLENLTTGKKELNRIYQGGIELQTASGKYPAVDYLLTAYARSYDMNSGTVLYRIRLIDDNYKDPNKESSKVKIPAKPGKVTLSKVAGGKRKIAVKWKNLKNNVTGYQILIRNSKGKKVCLVKVKQTAKLAGKKSLSKIIKSGKLKKGVYRVQIRGYHSKYGKTVYGKWSKAKKVKIKQ